MVNASTVLPLNSQTLLGFNQETYQHLQLALQSVPPHRLWIAVCDDLTLQRQVAAALDQTLLGPAAPASEPPTSWYWVEDCHPDWVATLMARPSSPGPMYQQILGVEQLTYQSSEQQYQFLASLRQLAGQWPHWPCSLLLWLPHPWLQQVRRSAPELYRRCDRVFKFLGDPRPLPAIASAPTHSLLAEPGPWAGIQPPLPVKPDSPDHDRLSAVPEDAVPDMDAVVVLPDQSRSLGQMPSLSPELWDQLSTDLSQLEQPSTPPPSSALPPQHLEDATAAFSSATWAEAHRLRDQVEAGDHSISLLKAAIGRYEEVLGAGIVTHSQQAEGLNDLGSLYWMWAQQVTAVEARRQHLQHSIQLYEAALTLEGAALPADTLMRIHSNLGSVYCLQAAHGQPEHHLGQAVRAFHRALQYVDAEQDSALYVTVQTHLGTAYWSLAQQTQMPDYLHQAISAYGEALRRCSAHDAPSSYGQLQNNLGIAYWSLAQHERPLLLLEEAVAAYRKALAYRTVAIDPVGYGATQNNLGTAYWDLGRQYPDRDSHQHQAWLQAIAAYEAALSLSPEQSAQGFDLWATHHSLGVVYEQLALQGATTAKPDPFQIAIGHYIQALTGWQAEQATLAQTAFQSILNNLRHQTQHLGIAAQQKSLAQIPAALLPEIWRHL
ncbi:MAG: tetratricopeptide repeat protein [Cyanobacteria bacterium]|nr:tetratricopeptide repeat protein [Cyanobacteriota bacterium]MDA0867423.1 tetratricopeptide repeat protein [Cyanobacteriota bacterium]